MSGEDLLLGTGRTGGRDATTGVIMGRYAISVGCPDTEPPHGWTWTALSSIAQLESGHTPSRKHPEYWDGMIPWIGIKDATENHGRTISDTKQHVSELGLENSSARLLPANTVCLSRTASVGFVVVMGRPMATSQDFVNWVCSPSIEPHFLKYVLLAENEALWRFASGTTHQTIYYPEAKAFHVCLPPLPEQRRIAKILGDLDEKIELNRKMNETLEQMARALFKSWFVDFDPVRAKMEGRTPTGMDAATAALFPDRLVDSELGMIPEGWEVKALGDSVTLLSGGTPKTAVEEYWNGDIPWFSVKDVPSEGDVWVTTTEKSITPQGLRNSATQILPKGTTIVTARGTVGKLALVGTPMAMNQSCYGVRSRNGICHYFIYFLMREAVVKLQQNTHGSVFETITRQTFDSLSCVMPSEAILEKFESAVEPHLDSIQLNIHQSRTLSTLRDTLLPKLVSGEVRVGGCVLELV